MKINRENLLTQMTQFAQDGSGLVVGKPGIGKSYLLQRLQERLTKSDVLSLIIKIDNAFDSSDKAIESELKLSTNWIDTLSQIQIRNNNKAVLIFDGFDAARDETKRQGFLTQIKKAVACLKDKWNVIVSVRTYDASKSAELMRIFSTKNSVAAESIYSRKITVGELTLEEVEQAFGDTPHLLKFFKESTPELQQILHVPFFIKLLQALLPLPENTNESFKSFKSETQLLDIFWQRKVILTESHLIKETFLGQLTNLMVETKTLAIEKSQFSFDVSLQRTVDYLRSENIIDEVAANKTRFSFSHNILFDFAVSKVSISDNYQTLISSIETDRSRPFFFRPSYIYFFTSLWYNDNPTFWKLYFQLSDNETKEIQLLVRLILNTTVASEFTDETDLSRLISLNQEGRPVYIKNLLQSIRFIRNSPLNQDVDLLLDISNNLDLSYLFEFAFLLNRSIDVGTVEPRVADLGISARNLFKFLMDNRADSSFGQYFDRIGSMYGVELVAKTYHTDIPSSRALLSSLLEILNEDNFDITYIAHLADMVEFIVPYDPTFVSDVYKRVFEHVETSDAKTTFGQSVVLSFTSNRRQDYEMCYFRLQTFLPKFLSASPEIALVTGVEIINILSDKKQYSTQSKPVTFTYNGNLLTIIPSYIYQSSLRSSDRIAEMIASIEEYIESLLSNEKVQDTIKLLESYITLAKAAVLWRSFFKIIGNYPKLLLNHFFSLLTSIELLSVEGISDEIKSVIRTADNVLTDNQVEVIEQSLFKAFESSDQYLLLSYLAIIPEGRLQLERSKELLKQNPKSSSYNEPRSSSSITYYDTETFLKESGIDTSKHANWMELLQKLESFNSINQNNVVLYQNYKETLDIAIKLFQEIKDKSDIEERLIDNLLFALTKTVEICSRQLSEVSIDEFNNIKSIIEFSFRYYSSADKSQKDVSPERGYSPTPRMEATSALAAIFFKSENEQSLELWKEAINDSSKVVRVHAVQNFQRLHQQYPEQYFQILFDRFEKEDDPFVFSILLGNLIFKKDIITEQANRLISIIQQKKYLLGSRSSFLENYAETLLFLLTNYQNSLAYETLVNAYEYPEFCLTIIFVLFRGVSLVSFTTETENTYLRKKLSIIHEYVLKTKLTILKNSGKNLDETSELSFPIKLIDEVVLRTFFALSPSDISSNKGLSQHNQQGKSKFYKYIKPTLLEIINCASLMGTRGFILGHTAHYFIQSLNEVLVFEPQEILKMTSSVIKYSLDSGYTFDSMSIREIVKLTETLIADHREILLVDENFQNLLFVLDTFVNSGWIEALQLLWRLDAVFK